MNFYNPENFISPAYTLVMLCYKYLLIFIQTLLHIIFILENFYQMGGSKNSDVQEVARIDSFVNKNYTFCTCCAHFQVCTLNTHSKSDYFKVKQRAFS